MSYLDMSYKTGDFEVPLPIRDLTKQITRHLGSDTFEKLYKYCLPISTPGPWSLINFINEDGYSGLGKKFEKLISLAKATNYEITDRWIVSSVQHIAAWKIAKITVEINPEIISITKPLDFSDYVFHKLDSFPYWSIFIKLPHRIINSDISKLYNPEDSLKQKLCGILYSQFTIRAGRKDPDDPKIEVVDRYTRAIALGSVLYNDGSLSGFTGNDLFLINNSTHEIMFGENTQLENYSEPYSPKTALALLVLFLDGMEGIEKTEIRRESYTWARVEGTKTLIPSRKSKTWYVGFRIGEKIIQHRQARLTGKHSSPSPHIRRAHWHTYLTGPKKSQQKPILKWMPPIPVAMPRIQEELAG